MPYGLFWYELLMEGIDVLLVLALLVRVACGSQRWAVLIQPDESIGCRRSRGWHDQRLRAHRKLI